MTAPELLHASFKDSPLHAAITLDDPAAQDWNIRRGDTSTPVAVLRDAAPEANVDVMRRFCEADGVSIAPRNRCRRRRSRSCRAALGSRGRAR